MGLQVATFASLLLLHGCRSSLTDEKLVVAFNNNRELFDKLAALSAAGRAPNTLFQAEGP